MLQVIKCWVLLTLCLTPFFSQASRSHFEYLLHKSYPERVLLTDSLAFPEILKMPYSSAIKFMTAIEEKALANGDNGLYCEMKLMHLHYFDFKELTNIDSTISQLIELRRWAQKNKLPEYDICASFDLANNFYRKRDYLAAFENYIRVCDTLGKLPAASFPRKKEFLVFIANRYYNFGDAPSAKALLLDADSLPPTISNSLYRTNFNNKNTLGLIYRNEARYDSALYCFRKVAQMAKSANDTNWEGIAQGNIGIIYYLQKKYNLAIPLLEQEVKTGATVQHQFNDSWVNSALILAEIYLLQNQAANAEEYISMAAKNIKNTLDTLKYKGMLYHAMAILNFKEKQYQVSYLYSDSAAYYKDSVVRRDNKLLLNNARQKAEAQKHFNALKELYANRKMLILVRNSSIIFFCGLLVIGVLLWNRMRLKHTIRQNKLALEKALAEQELKSTTEQLNIFTRHLLEKNVIIERTEEQIQYLKNRLDDTLSVSDENEILTRLYQSTILTEEQWDEFKQLFNRVHKGFLLRLKEKIPGLSPAETRFVVMCKLKLNNREMASLMGVQPDSLRTYRHRLRKKLNLSDEEALEAIIDTI
ncbi:tetratricopeptide repeat protein [Taibaiella lutea]|uniref:Tetratricopeptide repeat protein n=1 Tax=Taibaiella lutea TaxID=2608001 RepID=A0A5M6CM94_9BACT|nr:tetratricopeptide repeat protein [Taibaiella lutea]KAA5536331.1 tetratricopeptide repeat protein [Taibaiella lutea]